MLTGYIYVDIADRDQDGYIDEARKRIRDDVKLPPVTPCCGADSSRPRNG